MWHHYRRTLIPTQLVILAICAYLYFRLQAPLLSILYYFAVMQAFAVLGVLWSMRLRRKFQGDDSRPKLRKIA